MSNVASLELCRELYELSGWDDTYLRWAMFKDPKVVNADEWAKNMNGEPDLIITAEAVYHEDHEAMLKPAYDLGYLLRKLPGILDTENYQWYLQVGLARENEWSAYYMQDEDYRHDVSASTPEDAAAKLAIELFKSGVVERAA